MEAEETETSERNRKSHSIMFYVVFAAILYAVIQVHSLLSPILLSFLLILLITLAVNPIITRLRNWTGGRKRATALILLGLLTFGGLTSWAAVGPLKHAVTTLSERLPDYWERLQKPLIKMEQKGKISEKKMQVEVSAEIAREISDTEEGEESESGPIRVELPSPIEATTTKEKEEESIRSNLGEMVDGLFGQFNQLANTTSEMFVVLVTVFFGVTFTLMNPRPIFGALFSVVPERHHVQTLAIMVRIAKFVPRWAVSVLVSMLTIGSLFFLLMWPIFGVGDAVMLGLIAFLLSAIPFLGPLLTLVPALLLAIDQGGMTPVWVLLAYLAVQALEGNVILPLVMSQGMALHPVAVIFSMLLSVALFGVLGVLIAAPMVAILGIVHEEIYRKRFLPTTTDKDLDHLARVSLLEKRTAKD